MKKIIALFMPQYHTIPENDIWWGKGYTEWDNVKHARQYNDKQYQPRIPLNNNYYDLLSIKTQEWEANLAQQYGIYGFCYYHYWFTGKLLLEKPMEIMLANKNISLPFCISWANHTWRRSQSKDEKYILIEQKYGDRKDWEKHFSYLLKFFKDNRYIKIDNKPLFIIHDSTIFHGWNEMFDLWNSLAKKNGFDGIYFVNTLKSESDILFSSKYHFDAQFEFQPTFALYSHSKAIEYSSKIIRNLYRNLNIVHAIDYNKVWREILRFHKYRQITTYLGAYIDWDNTPRWKTKGSFHKNANPENFKQNFSKLLQKSKTEFVFINAWNEWGEGAYLEPDEKNKYGYLEAIRECQWKMK